MTKFTPLHPVAAPYYSMPYAELPPALTVLLESRTFLDKEWDLLSPRQREATCISADFRDDPQSPSRLIGELIHADHELKTLRAQALQNHQHAVAHGYQTAIDMLAPIIGMYHTPTTPTPVVPTATGVGMNPKERSSLLKIIGALASQGWNVARRNQRLVNVKAIAQALHKCGVDMDKNALGKHLNDAYDEIKDSLPPQKTRIR